MIWKASLIIVSTIIVTSMAVDAVDTWQGSDATLLAQLVGVSRGDSCPAGMVPAVVGQSFSCIDAYEASPDPDCPVSTPASPTDTEQNVADADCLPRSAPDALPWRFVSRPEAERLCARASKRLPTAGEWYVGALDTPDIQCNTKGGQLAMTGGTAGCVSALGAYDAVGNVWEWVSDDVIEGQYRGRPVPPSGQIVSADADGVATETGELSGSASPYGTAYFWSQGTGAFGMIRGGFYGSRGDAGVYAVHAYTPVTFVGEAVGFRCVR
jgi:formylglycine-generating enzyme required for sulfatase activity